MRKLTTDVLEEQRILPAPGSLIRFKDDVFVLVDEQGERQVESWNYDLDQVVARVSGKVGIVVGTSKSHVWLKISSENIETRHWVLNILVDNVLLSIKHTELFEWCSEGNRWIQDHDLWEVV